MCRIGIAAGDGGRQGDGENELRHRIHH